MLDLVRHKDKKGFYKQYEVNGRAMTFNEKVILESKLYNDRYVAAVKSDTEITMQDVPLF